MLLAAVLAVAAVDLSLRPAWAESSGWVLPGVRPMSCSGCCSSHGGITSSCAGNGNVICHDGSTSPSCSCSQCGLSIPPPPPPSCSYTYTAWSTCQPDGTEYRFLTGTTPSGCVGSQGPLTQSCVYVANPSAPVLNYTAMWWNPQESGWGININHQSNTLFTTLFTYASDNAPMWLVGANLALQVDGSYQGAIYRVTGPAFSAMSWTSATATQVGSMTVRFTTDHTAALTYTVDGITVTKTIEKEIFDTPTICVGATGSRANSVNYQDMWWNPQESGWGINISHQGTIVFAVLFIYGTNNRDWWLVGPNLAKQTTGEIFSGALYSVTGPVYSAQPWTPIAATEVGTMVLQFVNGETARLTYTVNGVSVTKTIQREVFGTVVPLCR